MMKFLQKIGKSLMLPVACLPLCGILMGIGYLLCPASMQGGEITGTMPVVGMFLVKAGGALIDHIALLFAVGVGVGMSDDQNGTAGLTALVSWLIITTLLQVDFVKLLMPTIADQPASLLAFQKIENPFIGILTGIIGAQIYNRFKNTDLPEWLAFFSRRRCTVIISGLVSILVAAVLFFIWPILFGGLVSLGQGIADMGAVGAGIYAFLNRLLIPLGLHHALNNVFWFDTIGLGDLTHFWAGHTDADVPWSLGIYMSGFFPCMMFGIPGAALAIIHCANPKRRKYVIGILGSAALCSFVCGVTEPFEFAFMFCAPMLYVAYALLYGIFSYATALLGFRAGFSFSAGATDLLFSSSLPAAQNTWLILPLGIVAFVVFYVVFRVLIRQFNLPTPGNEPEDMEDMEESIEKADIKEAVEGIDIEALFQGLGGVGNIVVLDNCATRLRLELKDDTAVDENKLKAAGAKGVFKLGDNNVQVVIGMKVQKIADIMKQKL
ncbi:PTS transporter subunit EIIC [Anaerovibrio sp.]|uniref:PTS transporter subunit EIIC n=1 Tax=Anaerovibrio sp. TaxID=1872532 RepID=UPI0025C0108F|nr:PTS transporter subunit EIIC [Anaerovibrio sp.]MBR2143185.1 PTS transporter subunit EIIC [Anaerovibrio sp.]